MTTTPFSPSGSTVSYVNDAVKYLNEQIQEIDQEMHKGIEYYSEIKSAINDVIDDTDDDETLDIDGKIVSSNLSFQIWQNELFTKKNKLMTARTAMEKILTGSYTASDIKSKYGLDQEIFNKFNYKQDEIFHKLYKASKTEQEKSEEEDYDYTSDVIII